MFHYIINEACQNHYVVDINKNDKYNFKKLVYRFMVYVLLKKCKNYIKSLKTFVLSLIFFSHCLTVLRGGKFF